MFYEVINQKCSSLIKSVSNKIDEIFCEAIKKISDDEEKTDFSNAFTKIKRKLDQDLRIFKEYLDGESNKKLSESLTSAKNQ